MPDFHSIYIPITSRPFLAGQAYTEYKPCPLLRPYVACYWTSAGSNYGVNNEVLVIPDTCMDVILYMNHTKQSVTGYLCGIQDRSFVSRETAGGDEITVFAIRFYFWAAALFVNLDFRETGNRIIMLEDLGYGWKELFGPFFYITDVNQRIAAAEAFLRRKLDGARLNPDLFNSIRQILYSCGKAPVKDICAYGGISQRRLERLFLSKIGLPPKRISKLVRYQNVWREMAYSQEFDIQDAVYRYGYTDQAHLLNEFRRFHGAAPAEAKRIAYTNR